MSRTDPVRPQSLIRPEGSAPLPTNRPTPVTAIRGRREVAPRSHKAPACDAAALPLHVSKKIGRPTLYSPDIAEGLLNWLADGKSLRKYCDQPGTPNKATVLRWLASNRDFSDQYARAREAGADSHLDDIVDIADTDPDPKRARVRIDARKWVASKLAPRKYGDRLDLSVEEKPKNRQELQEEAEMLLRRMGLTLTRI